MKNIVKYTTVILLLSATACNSKNNTKKESNTVFPKGDKITNNNFTGTAYLQPMIAADSLNPTAVGNVTFEPGARSSWHLHPAGKFY